VEPLRLKPERQPFPVGIVAFQRQGAFAVPFKVFWNPGIPTFAIDHRHAMVFFGFQLSTQGFGLGGVVRIVGTKAGGTMNLLLVGVEINDIPKRRAGFAI